MNTITDSLRAELLRLRKWPAVWVTLAAWLFLALLFGYVFNYVTFRTGSGNFSNEEVQAAQIYAELLPEAMPGVLVQGMPLFGGALMMVLGAIVAGNGYAYGTWKTIYTQGPSRSSVTVGSEPAAISRASIRPSPSVSVCRAPVIQAVVASCWTCCAA